MKSRCATLAFALAQTGLAQTARPAAELKYVMVVTRHGVRAPTWTPDRLNQYSTAPWPDFGVPPGNLTVHGRVLMKIMGGFYRDLFPAQAQCGHTYFWADTDQRTLETAKAVAEGMLPGCNAEVHSRSEGETDPLFDPVDAGEVKADSKLALASVKGRIGPDLSSLVEAHRPAFDTLAKLLNGDGKAARSIFDEPVAVTAGNKGAAMTGPLSLASTLSEDFLLEYGDGMTGNRLGWGRLDLGKLQQMMSLHTAYADLMRRTPYLAAIRGGNLLQHILGSLEQAATGKPVKGALGPPGTTFALISGHDTNISNLSGLLRLSWVLPTYQPDDAPPGGALVLSLWKSATKGQYSVRLQFVAQTLEQMHEATPLSLANPPAIANLFVPGCSGSGDGYECAWADFLRLAKVAVQ